MKKLSSTIFKKEDKRLIGNKFALGNKPNQTSFKKGEHKSLETEFKKGEMSKKQKGQNNSFWKGGVSKIINCIDCKEKTKYGYTKRCKKCWHLFFKGKNHPNWLGGKSYEPYGIEFNTKLKEQIRRRDNRKCQECNFSENELKYRLSVHHIDYNKKNNVSSNLISLCRSCHLQTNYKRRDWENYFKQKILL